MCSMKGCRVREALSGRPEDRRPAGWTMAKSQHTGDGFPRAADAGATPRSTDLSVAATKASTRVSSGQAAIARVLRGEVLPGSRRRTHAQRDWQFAPKAVSSHRPPHRLPPPPGTAGHVCDPSESKGHRSRSCCLETRQTYSSSGSHVPAFSNTRGKYLVDGSGHCVHCLECSLPERKLDARHFGCPHSPVRNPKCSFPEYSAAHCQCKNEITEIRHWSDKVQSNFSYKKNVIDKNITVENKINTMLERLKYLKTVFSSPADKITLKKNVPSKKCMDQLGDKLELRPRNMKHFFQENHVSSSGKHSNVRKHENDNTANCYKNPEEKFSSESDKNNENEIFRREDDTDFELPVKLKAENYRHPNADFTETITCARSYNSNIHHTEPPATCSSHGCSDTGSTAHPAENKEKFERAEISALDSKPSDMINDLAAKKHTSAATCEQSKIKRMIEVKEQHHHPLPEAMNCRKWKQRTTSKANICDALARTNCGLLCSKVKVTPHMILNKSLAMEMSTLFIKVRKLLPHKNCCTFSIKNINLTGKHFKTFMTNRKNRFMSDSVKASIGNRSVQAMGQCAKVLSDLDSVGGKRDEYEWMAYQWEINTGKVSDTMEEGNFFTRCNFKANNNFPVRLGRNFRTNIPRYSQMSLKTPEETRCLGTEDEVNVLHLRKENSQMQDDLRQYDGKSRTISMKDVSKTVGSRCIRIVIKNIEDNMGNKVLFIKRYFAPCKQLRRFYPRQDVAGILTIPRKHFGIRPSHFYRLFYLCTLKEAFNYDSVNSQDCLFSSNKKSVRSGSESGLHSNLRLLPGRCRSDSTLPHSFAGQNEPATLKSLQVVELTTKRTAVSCSGGDGSEQTSLGLPLLVDITPGVAESLRSKYPAPPDGRRDSLSKSDKGKMSSPCRVKGSEKKSGNKMYSDKEKAETKQEAPLQRNEDVVDQRVDCSDRFEQRDMEKRVMLCRSILEKCLEEACLGNDRKERTSTWRASDEAAGTGTNAEEKTHCSSSDGVTLARPSCEHLVLSDGAIFPDDDKDLESSAQITSKFMVDIVLSLLEDTLACRNCTEKLNGASIQDTINFKDLEGETETMLLETVIRKSRTELMPDDGFEYETNTSIPANSNERGHDLDCGQISWTAHEVIHGLLLQMLTGICERAVPAGNTDQAAAEAAGSVSRNSAGEDVEGDESDDGRGERGAGQGVVRRMLELYSKCSATEVTSQLKAELQARSGEIGSVPAGVVRERREMFAKMSTLDGCPGPEGRVLQKTSTSPVKLAGHAPAAEQADQAAIIRDASETEEAEPSGSPDALGTEDPVEYSPRSVARSPTCSAERPPYHTNTLSLKGLALLLFLCFVFRTSCHVLSDHSRAFS